MTEHLPECLVPDFDKGLWICICNQLRACEERMRREGIEITYVWDEDEIEAIRRINFSEGRNAAREAVAALPEYRMRDTCVSAIDELREDSETPPPLPPSVGVPEGRWK